MKKYDVIILRTPDRIGDYILWHDTICEYEKKFHGKKVLLITDKTIIPIAKNEALFSEILPYEHKKIRSLKYLYYIIKKFRGLESDILIYPFWTRSVIGDFFVSIIKANQKITMRGSSLGGGNIRSIINRFFNRFYTTLVESVGKVSEISKIECFTQNIISLNYKYGLNFIKCDDGINYTGAKYAVIALSASNDLRVWEMKKYAQVIDSIPLDFDVILSGYGNRDLSRAKMVLSQARSNGRIKNLVNKTSLPQLISLICNASFVIGNDSSAIHIAAATHTYSICITPGAHFDRFVPYPNNLTYSEYNPRCVYYKMDCYGCNYNCIKKINGNYECLKQISAEMVINELRILLEEKKL